MSTRTAPLLFALALAFVPALAPAAPAPATPVAHVVLAGGCFWGMQAVFERLRGVVKTTAGYAGGPATEATYEQVSTGTTGHAESVDIWYDPSRISFRQLLDVYFTVAHDPTQVDGQGADMGPQYRSEIFYTTTAQKNDALTEIAELTRSHRFHAPIATRVAALARFYAAEDEHQFYVDHHPLVPYVIFVDKPKLRELHERFPQLER